MPDRKITLRMALYVFLVLFISNLGAMADFVIHPDIPYFDEEHLMVGGITAITMILLLGALELYLARRGKIEVTLRKSEERHRAILQTAMDGIWMMDMQGRLVEVNEAYCRMSGYSLQELLAMHIADLEVVESHEEIAARMQKIMAQGEDRFTSRHRRKDGSIFNVEVSVQYRRVNGGELLVFLHDITERKRAEEVLKSQLAFREGVVDSVAEGICV